MLSLVFIHFILSRDTEVVQAIVQIVIDVLFQCGPIMQNLLLHYCN